MLPSHTNELASAFAEKSTTNVLTVRKLPHAFAAMEQLSDGVRRLAGGA
jgi:hypothetical protein